MERLSYRNRFVKEIVQSLEGFSEYEGTPQVISGDGINTIILDVTLEEWKRLVSSVFTGADICYPDISDTVRWVLLRSVEQPVSICERIIQCIENDADVQAALENFIVNSDAVKDLIDAQIALGKPINPEIGILQNDDLDALFGAITFLVDTIDQAIVDFNQDAEAANNSRELGQIIFAAVPLIETLPFNEASEYIDTLFEQIIEVYDSQWDETPITGTRDRIRCDLFCIARDNGNALTWNLVSDYFYQRTGFSWSTTLNIMLEFANFLFTGTWSGEEVVDIAFGNFAAAMSGMGKFGEMLFPSLTSIMRLGQNNPDPDWEILCDDCSGPSEYVYEWDFTGGDDGGWSVNAVGQGSIGVGGWVAQNFGPFTGVQILKSIPSTANVLRVEVDMVSVVVGTMGAGVYVDASVGGPTDAQTMLDGTNTYSVDVTPQSGESSIVVARVGIGATGSGVLVKIRYIGVADPLPAFTGGVFL